MRITVEGKENIDFPFIGDAEQSKIEVEQEKVIREKLNLRDIDQVIIKNEYVAGE